MEIRITFDGTENEFQRHAILDAYRQILSNLLRDDNVAGSIREVNLTSPNWEMIQSYQRGYAYEKVMNPKPAVEVVSEDSTEE